MNMFESVSQGQSVCDRRVRVSTVAAEQKSEQASPALTTTAGTDRQWGTQLPFQLQLENLQADNCII